MGVYNWDDYYSDAVYQTFCIDAETLAGSDARTYACVPLTEARATPGLTQRPAQRLSRLSPGSSLGAAPCADRHQ